MQTQELEEAKIELEVANFQWKDIAERSREIRQIELLNYYHSKATNKDEDKIKMRKETTLEIKIKLFKTDTFHCITRRVGKWDKYGIKRTHAVDDNNQIIETCINWELIER